MILNTCRLCGCPLDPAERYCDECQKIIDGQDMERTDTNGTGAQGECRVSDGMCERGS